MIKSLKPLLLSLALMMLTSISLAQSNGEAPLFETGKAEKIGEPATTNELKIISYNIRWRSGEELQQIIRWVRETAGSRPAIVGLQEVDRKKKRSGGLDHAKSIAEGLGMHYVWAAPDATKSKTSEAETGVAILSPYPLNDVTRIVLPHPGPGGRLRVAIGATARAGKTSVRVYSIHSETRIPIARKMGQLRAVLDDLQKFPKDMPAIVLGDFNAWEEPAIKDIRKLFTNSGFSTPFPDDESTFAQKIVLFKLKLKLDWIWVRGLTPQSYGIDRTLRVSDHFPLWTLVTLPADKSNQ